MLQNQRKTIAVMICDIMYDYQDRLLRAISSEANKLGYNVAIFSSFSDYGADSENAMGESNIVNLPPYSKIDAFILCSDTSYDERYRVVMEQYIKNCDVPIVSIRQPYKDYHNILIRSEEAISEIVHHFVHVHHYKRIAFMSGPEKHPDSITRLNLFKDSLKHEGIPYRDDYLFVGDFWKNKGPEAADYYTKQVEEMPEAIVCANDYMAISLCTALIVNGYRVPEDIAISGYDNIIDTSNNMPPITTIAFSVSEVGQTAVKAVNDLMNGKQIDKNIYVKSKLKIRNSCGCSIYDMKALIETRVRQIAEYEKIQAKTMWNTFASISLQSLDDALGIGPFLNLLEEDNSMRNIFLCLGEAEGDVYPKYYSSELGYPEESFSVYSFLDRKEIETSIFPTSELIPPEGRVDDPITYFFLPLHHLNHTLGYIAVSYYDNYWADKTICNWLSMIGNSLEHVRILNENNRLLAEVNELSISDVMTGLYNRRGFEKFSEEQFQSSIENGETVMILSIDMDNLKTVNDKYGHAQGDVALTAIADAMTYASLNNEICARVGGDEFAVIGINYNNEKLEEFIRRSYDYLLQFNIKNEPINKYSVDFSYGYVLATKEDKMCLEECINLSDTRLYEQKRKKKGIQ
ncbi:MAG: GGDEF domain-containing protein [Lachnoclostridium sp.]|jgi:diguanylate cyclase (GGDEF)-like protein|nr:GGDEF domain-containing protein [Lachnoclostridium sp.]